MSVFGRIGYTLDRLIFDLDIKRPSMYVILFSVLFLSIFLHLFWPLWFVFLAIPYLNAWFLYLMFAQTQNPKRRQLFGILLPVLPLELTEVYNVNQQVLRFLTSFAYGRPKEIFKLYLRGYTAHFGMKFKAALNLPFGSGNPKTRLDIYRGQDGVLGLKPVIIFYYGAGWNGGDKGLYTPIAKSLGERGYVVVIPDYTHWPKATADEMLQDVESALKWTLKNIKRYGGDPNDVSVLAHGAGAHLVATTVIKSAIREVENVHRQRLAHHRDSLVAFGELRMLKGLILIAGSYDIEQKVQVETLRGIQDLACTSRLFGGNVESFRSFSPIHLLQRPEKRQIAHQLPSAWLLIHGDKDPIVPFESSNHFFEALQEIGVENLVLDTYHEADHTKYLYDLFLNNYEPDGIFSKINEYHDRTALLKRYKHWLSDHEEYADFEYNGGHIACAREDFQR
jgi:acetyl esterase/lipase